MCYRLRVNCWVQTWVPHNYIIKGVTKHIGALLKFRQGHNTVNLYMCTLHLNSTARSSQKYKRHIYTETHVTQIQALQAENLIVLL